MRVQFKLLICLSIFFSLPCLADHGPEKASLYAPKELVTGSQSMIVTNNIWASKAADEILKKGGNAFDAAIAAAFVLGLTEPQSSGLGGGGYALTYSRHNKHLTAYDGREVAPHSVNDHWFYTDNNELMSAQSAMLSPKAIGVPSEVALLYQIHKDLGHLSWDVLLQPAIRLANNGFAMSKRLHLLLNSDKKILLQDEQVRELFFTNNEVKPVGTIIKNPVYAETLKTIASNPLDFYQGKLADEIIAFINQKADMDIYNKNDFANYTVKKYRGICANYRGTYKICGVPPSAAGSVTAAELMIIYANNYQGSDYNNFEWIYQFLEASKLAFADRDQYLADPVFVPQPVSGLLNSEYLAKRSKLVSDKALTLPVTAGKPDAISSAYAPDDSEKFPGTTSIVIVDTDGNAISMTVTVEHQFGSHIFTHGFFLNNELTDFSFKASNQDGQLIVNRIEPGKRPRSSITPTMVFDNKYQLYALTGSPGGSEIICYVAKNLILMLDMNMTPASASDTPNFCATNSQVMLEQMSSPPAYADYLKSKGEEFDYKPMVSGVTNIIKNPEGGWFGAADPRREGVAIGN